MNSAFKLAKTVFLGAVLISGNAALSADTKSASGTATAGSATPAAKTLPTWRDYKNASKAFPNDPEKRRQYTEAAVSLFVKQVKNAPLNKMSPRDLLEGRVLCVHAMYVEGTKIMHGPDSSKMETADEVEALVKDQEQGLSVMKSAYSALKRLNSVMADKVAFEITKCSAVIAKNNARLEEVQKAKQQ